MTGLKLKGDLCFAFGSSGGWCYAVKKDIREVNFIGVLYTRGDSLFYNEAEDGTGYGVAFPARWTPDRYEAKWRGEEFLGEGLTEACATGGSQFGNVCIAYVTPEGKIGYRSRYCGMLLSDEQLIESVTVVSVKPDVTVTGWRDQVYNYFITHTDSGEHRQRWDFKDIMIANHGNSALFNGHRTYLRRAAP